MGYVEDQKGAAQLREAAAAYLQTISVPSLVKSQCERSFLFHKKAVNLTFYVKYFHFTCYNLIEPS